MAGLCLENPELLTRLLSQVSRSFYLTLRVLPRAIRPQIGLAYLLARTTDTIADTEILPVDQRLEALQKLRERIIGQSSAPVNFGSLAEQQGLPAEKILLARTEESLALLLSLPPEDLKWMREVLVTITSGQELDLRRFGRWGETPGEPVLAPGHHSDSAPGDARSTNQIAALKTAAELDDYTYRVAGCVGEFWTKMCRVHLFPEAKLDDARFLADGIRFGKGLQLVNILRDLPADLKNGRCYLPLEQLTAAGLTAENLFRPENESKFLTLFHGHLDLAEAHLAAGWRYTNTLPFSQFRVRLACAWPVLIGLRTLENLRAARVAGLQQRVKITRGEVRGILLRSTLACWLPPVWKKMYSPRAKAVASGNNLA